MAAIEDVKFAIEEWLSGLDEGNLARMLATLDPDVVICNEHQATGYGIEAVREKYGPRIQQATFKSGFESEYIKIYDSFAVVVGHFTVEVTQKETAEKQSGAGRLTLVYRKHPDGWKMLLDVDNNGAPS